MPETAFYDEIAPQLSNGFQEPAQILGQWRRLPEIGLEAEAVLALSGDCPSPARLFSALLELYAEKKCKPRSGEKTPTHLKHVPTIMADFPGSAVICLVRDGRDVALSLRSMPWFEGDLAAAAQEWQKAAERLHRFAKTYARRFLVVRYENLVSAPAETLASVMTFLGLDFQPAQLSPEVASSVVVERSLLWKGRALTPVDKTMASARRPNANPNDLVFLNKELRLELKRLGYRVN